MQSRLRMAFGDALLTVLVIICMAMMSIWLAVYYGPRMLWRQIKTEIACTSLKLEPDQIDVIREVEQRFSPFVDEHGSVTGHELLEKARAHRIPRWRIELVL